MKKLISFIVIAIITMPLIFFFSFYFYAKQPTLSSTEYYSLVKRPFPLRNASDTISITTFNIGYLSGMTNNLPLERTKKLFDQNLEKSIRLFDSLNSDLIGLQEIDFGSKRSYQVNQLESLAKALEYPVTYHSVNWDKTYLPFPYWPIRHQFGRMLSGQAILSRYPVSNAETVVLEKPENVPFLYNSFYIDRLIQLTDVLVGDRVVKVMNVHLEAFDEDSRVQQAWKVKEVFEQYASKMPVIMMGDFNSRPVFEKGEIKAMEVIMQAEDIRSAISRRQYEINRNQAFTFSSGDPTEMIDYILYNSRFVECLVAGVVEQASDISDHLPVSGYFVLKPQID